MVKLLSLLSRTGGISRAQFMKSWVDEAPLFFKELQSCRRYVQYHLHPDPKQLSSVPVMELVFDGIEEIWLDGENEDAELLVRAFRRPAQLDHCRSYVGAMSTYVFNEVEIKGLPGNGDRRGHGLLKRLVPLVRKASWTRDRFSRHWREVHGPLLLALEPGPQRYSQLHVTSEIEPPIGVPTLSPAPDGFSVSWFIDEAEMNAGGGSLAAKALAADNHLSLDSTKRFFYDEVDFI
jgi:hypothetical protein